MFLPIDIQLFADGGEGGQGNAGSNQNGGTNAREGGNTPKTYTQEELDRIVNERTGRATKSALKSFFSQKGLSEEEAAQAMNSYLEEKKKNTTDVAALQSSVSTERTARLRAELENAAMLEALKQGTDVKSVSHVLKLCDFDGCREGDGAINAEKLSKAVKAVLDDVPAFKTASTGKSGVSKVGGDGGDGQKEADENMLRGIFGIKTK